MNNYKHRLITALALSISMQAFGAAMSQKDQEKLIIKNFITDMRKEQEQFNEKKAQALYQQAQEVIPSLESVSDEDKVIAISQLDAMMNFFKKVPTQQSGKRGLQAQARQALLERERKAQEARQQVPAHTPQAVPASERAPMATPVPAPSAVEPRVPARAMEVPYPVRIEQMPERIVSPAGGKIARQAVRPSAGYSRMVTPEAPTIQRARIQQLAKPIPAVKPTPVAPIRRAPKAPEVKKAAALQQQAHETKLAAENPLAAARAKRAQLSAAQQAELDHILFQALDGGYDSEKVENYLLQGANPNSLRAGEPLFWGLIAGYGAFTDAQVIKGQMPIIEVIKLLEKFGTNFNQQSTVAINEKNFFIEWLPPMNLPVGSNFLHFIAVFGTYMSDIQFNDMQFILKQPGMTWLRAKGTWYASHKNVYGALIKTLVEFGIDVNARDNEGNTPLHAAARSGMGGEDFINALIKYGADINARNNLGQTPLIAAVTRPSGRYINGATRMPIANPNSRAIRFLLDNGANPFVKDSSGNTASDYLNPNRFGKNSRKRIEGLRQTLESYKQVPQAARQPITQEESKKQREKVHAQARAQGREAEITQIPEQPGIRNIVAEYLFGAPEPLAPHGSSCQEPK